MNTEKYLKLILEKGRKMVKALEYVEKNEIKPCLPKCASCLAATARSKIDEDLGEKGFCLAEGDISMLQARDILAKELNWVVDGEEEKKIVSKNQFDKQKHEHLENLKCPKCGKGLKPIFDRDHLVGCMEYEIFLCDEDSYETGDYKKHSCRILIINYTHDSAGKENRIIEL